MPSQHTGEHHREELLDQVRVMVEYWDGQLESAPPASHSTRERLEGLAHSILTAIDERPLVLVPEDSSCATQEVLDADISGTINDDLFAGGIWHRDYK